MLRQTKNELQLTVKIQGVSPLLIKDGRESMHSKGDGGAMPHMVFQSRLTPKELREAVTANALGTIRPKLFIPGSSVRGAWRSHLEKSLRSLDKVSKVCDPFAGLGPESGDGDHLEVKAARADDSCSSFLANQEDSATEHAYRESCPICQLFGNAAQGSRIAFGDGKVTGGTPALIDNNAISRQTGAAISPFKSLVLLNAEVETEIQLRNFELWQAGLLAHLFDDLANGFVRLGSGKSKGWGRVTAKAATMKITYFGLGDRFAEGKILGVPEMLPEAATRHYGMRANASVPPMPASTADPGSSLWRHSATITDPGAFWDACRPYFNEPSWNATDSLDARRTMRAEVRA